tara:strand:+ start:312 stop:695 length:384 start_codon:yes stop_codon:yes gene_type:complete
MLFMISCETSHTHSKVIMNNSDYFFELHVTDYYGYGSDTIIHISPGMLFYISSFEKLGNHPNSLPTSPCSIHPDYPWEVFCDGYIFTGDFYDEYNWEEDFDPGRASHQHCSYNIDNEDFLIDSNKYH